MSFYSDASLVMIPSGYKTSKVYSAVPTDGSGDLTFSRTADTATRVGPDGLIEKVRTNLATYSNDFSNGSWAKVTDGTYSLVTESITDAFGNTSAVYKLTLLTGSYLILRKTLASATTQITAASLYVKKTISSTYVELDIDNNAGTLAASNTNWQRLVNTNATASFVDITTYGVNEPFYIFASQVEYGDIATSYIATTTAAVSVGPVANVPRLDYLNSSCPRLLLEPQRTNLALYSEQFNNAAWTQNQLTVTANNLVSPDGYTNADTALETSSNAFHDLLQTISVTSGTTYTLSSFVKAAGRDYCYLFISDGATPVAVKYNLATGVVLGNALGSAVSSSIVNYGNGWYRCSLVYTAGATNPATIAISATNSPALSLSAYTGDITKGIAVYGAQLEAGAYATSYIPTLGAAVTRGADACSKTGISSLIGQTEGAVFIDFVQKAVGASVVQIQLSDGSNANRVQIENGSSGSGVLYVFSGSSLTGQISLGTFTAGTRYKIAATYKLNDFAVYVNGVLAGTDTSGAVPVSMSRIDLGAEVGTPYTGYELNQALLFKTRLSNADLAALTA